MKNLMNFSTVNSLVRKKVMKCGRSSMIPAVILSDYKNGAVPIMVP